jgi:hypothetical protein
MTSVDVCRLNKYDNPDLVYGRHDGTIIKRLFSAFSFRPTVVATLPVISLFSYNPYSQNVRPTVTSIPMINVRVNTFGTAAATAAAAVAPLPGVATPTTPTNRLSDALTQTLSFLEGNSVVPRHTSVMFSREILVFYVDRRSYIYNLNTSVTNLARLPTSVAGFERINETDLSFQQEIPIGSDTFNFTSAVVAQVNDIDISKTGSSVSKYVVGSSAYIALEEDRVCHYTPNDCVTRKSVEPNRFVHIDEAKDDITKRGIILIYINKDYKDPGALVF